MKKDKKVVENKKKKMKPITKLLLCLIVVALIIGGYIGFNKFFKKNDAKKPKVVDKVEIDNVDYVVNEKDSKLFKDTFNELKKTLNVKEVDNKKYAEVITKLFVIDFFTLSNKTSKNDVGGVQFVFNSYKTSFVDYARDGIYKQVTANLDGNTNDILPTVSSVTVNRVEEVSPKNIFSTGGFTDDMVGYEINISWKYKNSDNFMNNATITVVPDGKKMSLAKMDTGL
jgi:hypothetical protein